MKLDNDKPATVQYKDRFIGVMAFTLVALFSFGFCNFQLGVALHNPTHPTTFDFQPTIRPMDYHNVLLVVAWVEMLHIVVHRRTAHATNNT